MRKYDIRICKCGRIHAIPEEKIDNVLKYDKDFLLICGNCGKATLIGGNLEPDFYSDDMVYNMYSIDFSSEKTTTITKDFFETNGSHKGIGEIYYSVGYPVHMKSGQFATDCYNGVFSDRWYPDFYKIQRSDITVPEVMEFIDKYQKDRTTVDMDKFIRYTPDDVLQELACYAIDAFNWKGTAYENVWNK